jgi:cytochrome d ubiquinol oxidase subunit I
MTVVGLARLQFGVTTIYHFLIVPLTIGTALQLAILETIYWKNPTPKMRALLDFFGRLFLLNFALGVVTGILQEFQFGMNWSSYSRFVGDVFGAPLAVEALAAFFLESTFIAIWIFGWDWVSPRLHLWSIWLVAFGTSLSAFWILTANSFMQEPVGFVLRHGRAEMVNFFALLGNPQLWVEFPHTEIAALATGGFFVAGISAVFLRKGKHVEEFHLSFRVAILTAAVASILVIIIGHEQAQHLIVSQPMKMAASEALYHTSSLHAPWTLIAWIGPVRQVNRFVMAIPYTLSILAYNSLSGRVVGIDALQHLYVHRYGPGWYVPPIVVTFWAFRLMILTGFLMAAIALRAIWLEHKGILLKASNFLRVVSWSIGLPLLGNIMGWVMTEVGRQPWIVFSLMKTADGVSPTVPMADVWITLVGFGGLYGILGYIDTRLLIKYVRLGPEANEPESPHPPLFQVVNPTDS